MAYLEYIEDERLISLVSEVLTNGLASKRDAEKKFHRNVIDPFTTLFDAAISGFDHATWKEAETVRQYQKTLSNSIGNLHQKILGHVNGWEDLGVGGEIDLRNNARKIIAEIKNKHNTLTGGKLAGQYHNLVEKISKKTSGYNGYTAYFVNIVPKKPERSNIPFVPSDPTTGAKVPSRDDVRIIDGASFYALVTGRDSALQELYDALPSVIEHAFEHVLGKGKVTMKDVDTFKEYFRLAYK
ncbi:Eco47II family restriction endonuclease [bacterium 19CA01SA08]|uniref:Eco47II family restriction endonuclease n=2 Tax=Bacteria TaxID=2 RepID=A0AAU6VXN7_UNCXX